MAKPVFLNGMLGSSKTHHKKSISSSTGSWT